MVYPQFKNKHREIALFDPKDYINWKKIKKNPVKKPTKYILIYSLKTLKYFRNKFNVKKINYNRLITIYSYKDIGVVLMTGIGSPHATTVLEELIALGGKKFLNIGYAGGLDNFGIFLCKRAIRDEGTSYHYYSHGKYSYPNKRLTSSLEKSIEKQNLKFQKGTTWTIDAPYRETKKEIQHYKKQGVKTVEMEASALFAVAKLRNVKIAAAFVVSDILREEKWNPQFSSKQVKKNLNMLMNAAFDCLSK